MPLTLPRICPTTSGATMSPTKKSNKAETPSKPSITANDLRKVAEAVDGIRGEPVNIAVRRDGKLTVGRASAGMQVGAQLAITCETDDVVRNRAKFKSVKPDPTVFDQKGNAI